MEIPYNEKMPCGDDFKPCPFTGEQPELVVMEDGTGCDGAVRVEKIGLEMYCYEKSGDVTRLKERLRDMWNQRVTDSQKKEIQKKDDVSSEIVKNLKAYLSKADCPIKISRSDTHLGSSFSITIDGLDCCFSCVNLVGHSPGYRLRFYSNTYESSLDVNLSIEDGAEIFNLLVDGGRRDFARSVNETLKGAIQKETKDENSKVLPEKKEDGVFDKLINNYLCIGKGSSLPKSYK